MRSLVYLVRVRTLMHRERTRNGIDASIRLGSFATSGSFFSIEPSRLLTCKAIENEYMTGDGVPCLSTLAFK